MENEVRMLTALAIVIMGTVLLGGLVLLRRRARRDQVDRLADELAAISARVDRVMTAVDAIAVEVERIGEADRFALKALAARRSSTEGRVITPH